MSPQPAILNLGCGSIPPPGYVNVDLHPGKDTIAHDLRKSVPFPDSSFDLVYHSTMLSQLKRKEALRLMTECRRVLRPGGVLRVVTEDLEQLARVYLQKLEAAWNGDRASGYDHEWLILEMYDQATRERPGGEMLTYLLRAELPNESFIRERIGAQGGVIIAGVRERLVAEKSAPQRRGLKDRARAGLRKAVLRALLGRDGDEAYDIGRFRLSGGSASHYMYDRFSLRELFRAVGFRDIRLQSPTSSAYSAWQNVNLDITSDGAAARPHCLIMEGVQST